VILVSGPTALPEPRGVTFVSVRSAVEMQRAVGAHASEATVVVAAAAVSDYAPAQASRSKLKKTDGPMKLELVRTPDILKGLGESKGSKLLVGFAAETEDLVENARRKLEGKNLDLIVANDVTAPGAGFGTPTNSVVLLRRDGQRRDVPLASKREVAERILDELVALRSRRPVPASA
jgi:phosphopantothenoylcysteine decarboxylase/phosphopantothenate--cysteine ligase